MKTTIIRVNHAVFDPEELRPAAEALAGGRLVAFPTETVYGLGADALNPEAVSRIFRAKGRPSDNPLIVHISDLTQLERIVSSVPEKARMLMETFWPGPLTLILPKSKDVPDETTAGLSTVAVRMPANRTPGAHQTVRAGHSCSQCQHFGSSQYHLCLPCYIRPFGANRLHHRWGFHSGGA